MRILLIERDTHEAERLRQAFEQQGFSVDVMTDAASGDESAIVDHHDLIVIATSLPSIDGPALCRSLRRQRVAAPILVLASANEREAIVAGLDAGADDCIVQPFQMSELMARVRSLLRRSQASEGTLLRSGSLVLDLYQHRATLAGVTVRLSAKEFALLEFMMRNPGRLLTRTMISESVWDMNYESSSNVIDVYVSSLRRKIQHDPGHPRIETVIGCGYRLVDPDAAGEPMRDGLCMP